MRPVLAVSKNYFSRIDTKLTNHVSNPIHRQATSRVAYAVTIPLLSIRALFGCVIGTIGCIGAVITAGTNSQVWDIALMLHESKYLLALPYLGLLSFINPRSNLEHRADGKITPLVQKNFKIILRQLRSIKNNFLVSKVVSRLGHALLLVTSVVTRSVDVAIGLVAAIFSFALLGTNTSLNSLAVQGLYGSLIIYDIFYGVVKNINPHAGCF